MIWVDRDDSRIRKADRSDSRERRQGITAKATRKTRNEGPQG